jgi:hypothetical protein
MRERKVDAAIDRVVKFARERHGGLRQVGEVDDLRDEPPNLPQSGGGQIGGHLAAPVSFSKRPSASSTSISDGATRSTAAAISRLAKVVSLSVANQQSATLASTTISLTDHDLP